MFSRHGFAAEVHGHAGLISEMAGLVCQYRELPDRT